MKPLGLLLAFFAAGFLGACETQRPGTPADPRGTVYRLTVTFPSGTVIKTSASPDRTFTGTSADRDGKAAYAIGGKISPAHGSTVPLLLTVAETLTDAPPRNLWTVTIEMEIPLGQPTNISSIGTVEIDP